MNICQSLEPEQPDDTMGVLALFSLNSCNVKEVLCKCQNGSDLRRKNVSLRKEDFLLLNMKRLCASYAGSTKFKP